MRPGRAGFQVMTRGQQIFLFLGMNGHPVIGFGIMDINSQGSIKKTARLRPISRQGINLRDMIQEFGISRLERPGPKTERFFSL